jgi:hypothetical protein
LWWRRAPVIDYGIDWKLSGLLTVLVVGCYHPLFFACALKINIYRRAEANRYHHDFADAERAQVASIGQDSKIFPEKATIGRGDIALNHSAQHTIARHMYNHIPPCPAQ